ncbi:MAG: putative N-acetylmuramoyl-L-alanine amidase [Acidobacteria bacterium]|nr:putative N-acetylmuramoyl-L-alanine amidase [Acidobacteriota bacterium]
MKRFVALVVLVVLAVASIVAAQTPAPPPPPAPAPAAPQGTIKTATASLPLTFRQQNGQTYFAADDIVAAAGGTLTRDANGFKATLGATTAAFGTDSRFGVVRDELIEMPAPPLIVDGKPFATIQFFQGFLGKAADLDVAWDAAARVLQIRPQQQNAAALQVSVANIQGISKIVLTVTTPVDYSIVREPGAYTIHFKTPVRAPFAEQTYEDPYVARAMATGNDLRIQLTAPDVVADAYKLTDPFRIVLDVRKAAAPPPPGTLPPALPGKPVEQPGIHTIVIDPGHGGKDVGASGTAGLLEKEATLTLCRKLAASLGNKVGARVILTREDDSVVSLDQRTAIANQYKADLFLSVHMNAAVVKGAHGSETYFLSQDASDELAKKAAATENTSLSSTVTPAPASSDLKLILWDLAQQEYIKESDLFARSIQTEMNALAGVQGRGVKQAPFKVLVGATMPAALVEVAFISNPDEEAKLRQDTFQASVVDAITRAVQRYKTDYETRIGVIRPAPVVSPTTTAPTTTGAPTTTAVPAATTTAKKAGA